MSGERGDPQPRVIWEGTFRTAKMRLVYLPHREGYPPDHALFVERDSFDAMGAKHWVCEEHGSDAWRYAVAEALIAAVREEWRE